MAKITLVGVDDVANECLLEAAKMSEVIKGMIETLGSTADEQKPLSLPYEALTDEVLKKVIEWCEYHYDDPPHDDDFYEDTDKRNQELTYWDKNFISVDDRGLLFDIIDAANYLDIKGLIEVGAKHICGIIKGKTCADVRKILNIKNDFTPAEEEAIHKENAWIHAK